MKFKQKIAAIAMSLLMGFSVVQVSHAADSSEHINIKSIYGNNRYQTAAKVADSGWKSGSDTIVVVNGRKTITGIVATPLASINNAPILITDKFKLNSDTSSEIKRLKPKNIIILNDGDSISSSVVKQIKGIANAKVEMISANDPGQLSLKVAQEISKKKKVEKAYIVSNTNGVADALSISAKAGEEKEPVLVVSQKYISNDSYKYLKENISTAYFVGGTNSISKNLVSAISGVVKNGGEKNRIFGKNRNETNSMVIEKFYSDLDFKNIVLTKADDIGLIDTVAAGPFAALSNAPILITYPDRLSNSAKNILKKMSAENIEVVGGGISTSVVNAVKENLLNYTGSTEDDAKNITENANEIAIKGDKNDKPADGNIIGIGIKGKTIVIDAGHGGKDGGSGGLHGVLEKNWTLPTAKACEEYLKKAGANVIMTRTGDTYPTLQDRCDISNEKGAVFFCSIHYNSGGNVVNASTGELSGTGAEVYKGASKSADLAARNVLNSILSDFNLRNRGVKDGTELYVIRNTDAPAILVEGGFLSSSKDVNMLNNSAALKRMGEQIAKGIIATFEGKVIK